MHSLFREIKQNEQREYGVAPSEAEMLRFSASEQANRTSVASIVQKWESPPMRWGFSVSQWYHSVMEPTSLHINTMSRHATEPEKPQSEAAPSHESSGFAHWGDTVARFLLTVFCGLLPIFFIPTPWAAVMQGKIILATAFLVLATFFWAVARLSEGAVRIARTALIPIVGLLPLAYLVSAGASGWGNASIVGSGVEQDTLVAVVLWYAIFFLATAIFTDHRLTIIRAIRAFTFGLLILLLFQVLYVLFPSFFSLGGLLQGATTNIFGSWHDLGIVAGLALFLSGALWVGNLLQGKERWLLIVLGILATFLLVIIHFKDVLWSAGALLFIGGLSVARNARKIDEASWLNVGKRALPWILGAAIFVALGFFSATINEMLPAQLQINEVEVRPSWQGTLDIARQSISAPREFLFGAGPNSFIREWGLYKPQEVNLTPFWNSDFNTGVGVIPTSIFAVGILGLLAWAGIILTILVLFVRFVREVRPLVRGRALFGVTLASTAYLVGYHMIYTPGIALTGVTFLFLAFLAVCAAGDTPPRLFRVGAMSTTAMLSGLIVLSLCCVVVFTAGLAVRELASNMFVNRASVVYRDSGDLSGATRMIERALVVSPKNDRAHRAAAELGVVQLAQLAQSGAEDEAVRAALQETLERTIQHGLTAVQLDNTYQNWLTLAQIYSEFAGANVEGALESATDAYDRAFAAQPTNPIPKVRLAQIAITRGDADQARTYLQEAIALKPDLAIAYYLLSQVEAYSSNGDAAVEAAAVVVQLVPNDPLGWFNLGYILYSGGVYQESATVLEQAISLSPDYANAWFILGLSYNQLGRTDEAIAALERVAASNPSEAWIPDVIERIRNGEGPFGETQETQ